MITVKEATDALDEIRYHLPSKHKHIVDEVLDIINRQQAEIEKFKKIETTVNGFWEGIQKLAMFKDKEIPTLEKLLEYMDNLKVEAIKEFAERLKSRLITVTYMNFDDTIDNLVKEMVGEG